MSFFVTPDSKPTCFDSEPFPKTFIDILYAHRSFLEAHKGFLGPRPLDDAKPSVAIVGSGPAGLIAAWLLMKMGLSPVIYEASDRVGGRIWSDRPQPGVIFELGAMRVPRSEQLFQYFADQYGMTHGLFPDPGVVNTLLYFQNVRYDWLAGGKAPSIFDKVTADWNKFAGVTLAPVTRALQHGDYATARLQWQAFLTGDNRWSNISFFQGLGQQFPDWTSDDFGLFGALGIGSGGFGPLYPVNFAEIARLVVNGLESCQQFYPGGLGALVEGLTSSPTDRLGMPPSSLRDLGTLRTGERVESVRAESDGSVVVATSSGSQVHSAVILATTTRSMQIDMGLANPLSSQRPVMTEEAMTGIRRIHMMNSSKLFVRTRSKFWKRGDLPANIQTDGLTRGLYCLDYPETDSGVVLVSYTWGDDSTKLLALLPPEERFKLLAASLEPISLPFARALVDEAEEIKNIDWELEPNFFGAFKLNYPGQDIYNQAVYTQFLSALDATDTGVYLAGDSVSWSGGWIEGALQTGMNAAASVVHRLGGQGSLYPGHPLSQDRSLYDYGV